MLAIEKISRAGLGRYLLVLSLLLVLGVIGGFVGIYFALDDEVGLATICILEKVESSGVSRGKCTVEYMDDFVTRGCKSVFIADFRYYVNKTGCQHDLKFGE